MMEGYSGASPSAAAQRARDMSNANAPIQPERQRYVEQEMNRLSAMLSAIDSNADDLIARISCVLRPEPASPASGAKVSEVLCPLADAMSMMADKAGAIAQRLDSARKRLEI